MHRDSKINNKLKQADSHFYVVIRNAFIATQEGLNLSAPPTVNHYCSFYSYFQKAKPELLLS